MSEETKKAEQTQTDALNRNWTALQAVLPPHHTSLTLNRSHRHPHPPD